MDNTRVRRAGGKIADDILRDVFERLPSYQDLLRCAATCKRWRRLVTDRSFLRRIGLWPQTARHPSILAGIFYQITSPVGKPRPKHGQPPEFLNLQLGGAHTTFSSFVHGAHLDFGSLVDNDDGRFNYARPLASRRGLLLVIILPPTMFDHKGCTARDKLLLAVCRPVVDKQRSLLPLLSFNLTGFSYWDLTGCALLTDDDHGVIDCLDQRRQRSSSSFQVFLTYTGDHGIVYVYMYSSATDTWSMPTKFCQASHLIRCGPFAGVVARNTVHWLYKDETSFYTLDVNAITTHVSLTKIPIHVEEGCLQWGRVLFPCVTGEGKLSFVSMHKHGMLELWTKQEQDDDSYGREEWLRSDLINLGSKEEINNVFYAERRGAMLIDRCGGSFFTIDLKSKEKASIDIKGGEMESFKRYYRFPMYHYSSTWCNGVYGRRWSDFFTPVLYEMDWVFDRGMFSTSDQRQDDDGLIQ